MKKMLNHIFVDGFSGMASGLFATLIMGIILEQIGLLFSGNIGAFLVSFGKIASVMTGAGIGVGVAAKYGASPLVTVSAATAGMVGAHAGNILSENVFSGTSVVLANSGEPLGAFIAAFVAIEVGQLISGKTKLDIILTPAVGILTGSTVGIFISPYISRLTSWLASLINWGTQQHPFFMGMVVSVLMGIALTLPIGSAAIGIALNLSGLAAGAATVGCCCNMVGFAVASFKENGVGGFVAQAFGTSMLQMPNIMRHPLIWLPSIIASAVLGPLSTVVFKMTNTAAGSGMGSAGLIGQITTFQDMCLTRDPIVVIILFILMYFVYPVLIAGFINRLMRKEELIKDGDMKLDI